MIAWRTYRLLAFSASMIPMLGIVGHASGDRLWSTWEPECARTAGGCASGTGRAPRESVLRKRHEVWANRSPFAEACPVCCSSPPSGVPTAVKWRRPLLAMLRSVSWATTLCAFWSTPIASQKSAGGTVFLAIRLSSSWHPTDVCCTVWLVDSRPRSWPRECGQHANATLGSQIRRQPLR